MRNGVPCPHDPLLAVYPIRFRHTSGRCLRGLVIYGIRFRDAERALSLSRGGGTRRKRERERERTRESERYHQYTHRTTTNTTNVRVRSCHHLMSSSPYSSSVPTKLQFLSHVHSHVHSHVREYMLRQVARTRSPC